MTTDASPDPGPVELAAAAAVRAVAEPVWWGTHLREVRWQAELAAEPDRLAELIAVHGSPVNLIDPRPMGRNIDALRVVAEKRGLELGVYFARKANKCLSLVDEAVRQRAGVDVASEHELSQVLARGVDPGRVILTAAVKPRRLIERAVAALDLKSIKFDGSDSLDDPNKVKEENKSAGVAAPANAQ